VQCPGRWLAVLKDGRLCLEVFSLENMVFEVDHWKRKTRRLLGGELKSEVDRALSPKEAWSKLRTYTVFS
jgi:hypothetical protein